MRHPRNIDYATARGKQCDPMPDQFASVQEAGEFCDTYGLAGYEDQTR